MKTCFQAAAWGAVGSRCNVGRRLARVDLRAKILTEALRECKARSGIGSTVGTAKTPLRLGPHI